VQTVGGHAQQHLRILFANQAQGLHRLFWIGKRVARAGDADYLEVGCFFDGAIEIGHRLLGREYAAGHAGTALVRTIELTVAIVALDVAPGRDWQMDPAGAMAYVRVETWLLRPAVTEMQNALSSDSVVNGESHAHQRDAQFARDSIPFAVADQQIRFE